MCPAPFEKVGVETHTEKANFEIATNVACYRGIRRAGGFIASKSGLSQRVSEHTLLQGIALRNPGAVQQLELRSATLGRWLWQLFQRNRIHFACAQRYGKSLGKKHDNRNEKKVDRWE